MNVKLSDWLGKINKEYPLFNEAVHTREEYLREAERVNRCRGARGNFLRMFYHLKKPFNIKKI